MSDKYKAHKPEEVYFITFTIVDWINIFTRPIYKQLMIDSMIYCQRNKGLIVYAYCLMTNHIHLLVSAALPAKLSDIVRDFKKHTNKQIIKIIEQENESRKEWLLHRFNFNAKHINRVTDFKVWQDGYHAIECSSIHILRQKLDYIHQNPVRAQVVLEPQHYLYSSAGDYAGQEDLLQVEVLSLGFN